MQPVKIIVKDGIGREVNPYHKEKQPVHWEDFEQSIKSYPCPSLANTKPGETVEAIQIMQERLRGSNDDWIDCVIDGYDPICRTGYEQRIIWRLVPKEESGKQEEDTDKPSASFSNWGKFILGNIEPKEEKPVIIKRIDRIEETVTELVTLVNELSIAVRKRFDSLTPPTLK